MLKLVPLASSLALLALLPSANAAYLTSDFELKYGFSSFGIVAGSATALADGSAYTRTLESYSTLDFTYNLKIPSSDLAISLSFLEMISSNIGNVPFTRFSLGTRWYPIGMNGARILFDNDTEGRMWGPAPYIGASFGVTNLSVTDPGPKVFFNAVMFDVLPVIGIETPITSNLLFCPQLGYMFSLVGGSETSVSYSGLSVLLGLKYHSF